MEKDSSGKSLKSPCLRCTVDNIFSWLGGITIVHKQLSKKHYNLSYIYKLFKSFKTPMLIFIAGLLLIASLCYYFMTCPIFHISKKNTNDIHVSQIELENHVRFLSTIQPPRYYKNLDSIERCEDYILHHLTLYTDTNEIISYEARNRFYKVIVGSVNTKIKERIVIGAHYDVCNEMPGADDNASAVAGLLEISRLINLYKPQLNYRIDFAAYPLEEPPFFNSDYMGSFQHARKLKNEEAKIKFMISLEMIGYFSDNPNSQEYPVSLMKLVYPSTGNFIALVGSFNEYAILKSFKQHISEGSTIPVYVLCAPSFFPGVSESDHLSFWRNDFDALMITDTAYFRNKNYHSVKDTIDTLNFKKTAEVIKGIYYSITQL